MPKKSMRNPISSAGGLGNQNVFTTLGYGSVEALFISGITASQSHHMSTQLGFSVGKFPSTAFVI